MLQFDNRLLRELPGDGDTRNHSRQVLGALWSPVMPTPVAAPALLAYSREMADLLGLDVADLASSQWVNALAGNAVLPGMATYATCYGGHQFGNWAGRRGEPGCGFTGRGLSPLAQPHGSPFSRHATASSRRTCRSIKCTLRTSNSRWRWRPRSKAGTASRVGTHARKLRYRRGQRVAEPLVRCLPSFEMALVALRVIDLM